jgi:multicomponent Na+:H+ antiporter subunit E
MLDRFAEHGATLRRFLVRAAYFTALWLVLVEGDLRHPSIAAITIVAASLTAVTVRGGQERDTLPRVSISGLLPFIPYFLKASFSGGLDVARRAFRRDSIDPTFIEHRLRLPADGPALMFYANVMNLLPGTLCAEIDGADLTIQVIDRGDDPRARLGELERRVAALFHDRRGRGRP